MLKEPYSIQKQLDKGYVALIRYVKYGEINEDKMNNISSILDFMTILNDFRDTFSKTSVGRRILQEHRRFLEKVGTTEDVTIVMKKLIGRQDVNKFSEKELFILSECTHFINIVIKKLDQIPSSEIGEWLSVKPNSYKKDNVSNISDSKSSEHYPRVINMVHPKSIHPTPILKQQYSKNFVDDILKKSDKNFDLNKKDESEHDELESEQKR